MLKQLQGITTGITSVIDKVQQFLVYFEKKFRHIYEQDKDACIRRYEQAGKSAAFVEAEIQKFRDLSDEILMEENTATVCFLRLDCGSLKQHLVAHCEAWVTKLQALLQQMVTKQLLELHDTLESYIERWNSSTDEDDKMELFKEIQQGNLSSQLAYCLERYSVLACLQVSVSDDKAAQIQYIEQMWAKLKEILADFLQGGRRL